MKRMLLSLAAVAALLGTAPAGTALAQDIQQQAQRNWNGPSEQDRHQDGRGHGSGHGSGSDRGRYDTMNLEGRWVADDHSGEMRGGRGGRGLRDMLLPDLILIDQRPSMVRITDQRNHPLQTVMLGGKFGSRYGADRPDYLPGRWNGSTLVVERSTPRGATITQTFALQNRGHVLVVRTRREGFGPRTVDITTTYRRA
jgi:hypothetical protein